MSTQEEQHEAVQRLTRDLVQAAATLSEQEARFLVDAFYLMQDDRKRSRNQARAMTAEPHSVVAWLATQSATLEQQIKRALDSYTSAHVPGLWMKSQHGVGPIIAAGFLAHIDITRSATVGQIYSFAGIAGADQKKWIKGQKRPHNAALRTLCWKLGQCFMKFHKDEQCAYGHVYKQQKDYYQQKNDQLAYAQAAQQALSAKKYGTDTEAFKAYAQGKLPPAQIDARARRYAVKRFLSHMHAVMYWHHFQRLPPNPYALDHLGHAHFIMMPNIDVVPGMEQALRAKGLI